MLVGKYTGLSIKEAKPLIKQDLINEGLAVKYYEPESKVVSRSGEDCIVALLNQWYLNYGATGFKEKVMSHV